MHWNNIIALLLSCWTYFKWNITVSTIFHLYIKSSVGNDSTISEWLINYTGGFTKRGIIGQICIFFSRLFSYELRDIILYFQIITIAVYYILVFNFLKNVKCDRIFLLAIFTVFSLRKSLYKKLLKLPFCDIFENENGRCGYPDHTKLPKVIKKHFIFVLNWLIKIFWYILAHRDYKNPV